jgi:hypothetical protein
MKRKTKNKICGKEKNDGKNKNEMKKIKRKR